MITDNQMEKKIYRRAIEADIANHCNLSCQHCSHFSPHFKESYYDLNVFKEDVFKLSEILHSSIFNLLGGEPLLNKDILQYTEAIRQSKLSDRIHLITNGLLLSKSDRKVLMAFSKIEVSLYPEITSAGIINWVAENKGWLPPVIYRNRKLSISMFPETQLSEAQATESFSACCAPKVCNLIMNGRYYLCAQSAKGYLVDGRFPNDEGVAIHEENAKEKIIKLISQQDCSPPQPIRSCSFCNMKGNKEPHRQIVVKSKVSF